ncbi:MAG: glycosyltransferase family 4 protein [Patescibacteria group bacterium]
MKILYLFNKVRAGGSELENIHSGKGHDNHFYGMLRLRKYGIETDFLEIEQFVPLWFALFLRRFVFNIFWVHLPLFPLFFKYDIVFSSTAYGPLLIKAIFGVKKFKWVMLDFNISGTIGGRRTLRQKIFYYAVSKTDGIITISEEEVSALEKLFPHLRGRIKFLHEGIDTEFFKPQASIDEERFILSVGRDPSRDFKTLIEATTGLGVRVKLATKREMVKNLEPLPPYVSVEHFSHDEMLRQYSKAAIVVIGLKLKQKAPNDSMGTFAVAEAMSMGKAVIASKTNALASYIEDGVTGVLVPIGDVSALNRAIKNLMFDETKRHSMGRRAREYAQNKFSADIFAEGLAKFFKTLKP